MASPTAARLRACRGVSIPSSVFGHCGSQHAVLQRDLEADDLVPAEPGAVLGSCYSVARRMMTEVPLLRRMISTSFIKARTTFRP